MRRPPPDANSLSAMSENMINGVRNVDDALRRFLLRARTRQNALNNAVSTGNEIGATAEQHFRRLQPLHPMQQREQWGEANQLRQMVVPMRPRAAIPVAWTAVANQQEGSSSGSASERIYTRLRLRDHPLLDRNSIAAVRPSAERGYAIRRAIAASAAGNNGEWERISAQLRAEARARIARAYEEEASGEDELEELLGPVQYPSSGVGPSGQGGNGGLEEDVDGDGEEEVEEDELEASEDIEVDEVDCIMPTSSLSPPPLRDDSPSGSSSDSGLPSFATAFGPEPATLPLSVSGRRRRTPAGSNSNSAAPGSSRHHEEHYEYDVHLAGACFSPNGSHVYVGSVAGISEWRVRDHGQAWYSGGAWA